MRFFVSVFSLLLLSSLISCKNKPESATSSTAAAPAAEKPVNMEEKKLNPEKPNLDLPKGMAIISPDEFQQFLTLRTNVPLIDLRTPREYEIAHINRAVNIPFDPATFEKDIKKLQGANEVAVYCMYGSVSVEAAKYFEKLGVHQVIALEKGVAGWAAARKMMVAGEMDSKKK
jgi:rhodanese-related sulfurtransferase